jgi:hypothetical protein
MPNFVLLNNVTHKNLRIVRDHLPQYGDNEMSTVTFPQEFRAVQNEYPIFFQKNPENGKFVAIALLGLRKQENLFLSAQGWDAHYIPVSIKRRPFLIGIQPPKPGDITSRHSLMVYVDMDSPRLSETQGDAVFMPHGGYSPYLDSIVDTLDYIQYGTEINDLFVQALLQYQLLEVVNIDITLNNGEQNNLSGLYTIHEEKLAALDAEAASNLHSSGYMEFIYMVLASQANVRKLISRLEDRLQVSAT